MKMTTGEYQSTKTTYHWVSPQYNVDWEDHTAFCDEIWKWCTDSFGPPGTWSSKTWMGSNNKYYFVKESDRLLFILRWA